MLEFSNGLRAYKGSLKVGDAADARAEGPGTGGNAELDQPAAARNESTPTAAKGMSGRGQGGESRRGVLISPSLHELDAGAASSRRAAKLRVVSAQLAKMQAMAAVSTINSCQAHPAGPLPPSDCHAWLACIAQCDAHRWAFCLCLASFCQAAGEGSAALAKLRAVIAAKERELESLSRRGIR